jgi:putative membrane protein
MSKVKPITAGWILVIVYIVGVIGFSLPQTKKLMPSLVWVNLLFTAVILLSYHKKWSREIVLALFLIGACGFLLEVIGVKTGRIFGYYQYGPTLGFALWDTPLMMFVNWLTTIYITRQVAEMVSKDIVMTSLLAAVLMVLLDYFLEPFAIKYGLWIWNSGEVPMQNYVAWLVAGFFLQYLFIRGVKFSPNKLSLPVYLIQLAFFVTLFLINR